MKKKVGIMGGTFNPIHLGHLIMAEAAKETFGLDEILFIPTGISYLKDNVLDGKTRITMTGIAIEDNSNFALSTIEVDRDGISYSYETLLTLKEENPNSEYYFIAGADSLFQMEDWKHPEILFENCIVLAAAREGYQKDEFEVKIAHLKEKFNADIRLLSTRVVDITSTNIRNIVNENKSIRYMVHKNVYDYILKHQLYRDNEKE